MTYEYTPRGVCSRKMIIEIDDGIFTDVQIMGGCNGNLKGIRSLIIGMELNEIKEKLSFEIFVAHVNHQLRKEADAETQYVEKICKIG